MPSCSSNADPVSVPCGQSQWQNSARQLRSFAKAIRHCGQSEESRNISSDAAGDNQTTEASAAATKHHEVPVVNMNKTVSRDSTARQEATRLRKDKVMPTSAITGES